MTTIRNVDDILEYVDSLPSKFFHRYYDRYEGHRKVADAAHRGGMMGGLKAFGKQMSKLKPSDVKNAVVHTGTGTALFMAAGASDLVTVLEILVGEVVEFLQDCWEELFGRKVWLGLIKKMLYEHPIFKKHPRLARGADQAIMMVEMLEGLSDEWEVVEEAADLLS